MFYFQFTEKTKVWAAEVRYPVSTAEPDQAHVSWQQNSVLFPTC